MSLPAFDNGVASGLLAGILFGYVLESAGFASARKLTAQFRLTDWSVFKVMITAIVVAGGALAIADTTGLMKLADIFIPTNYVWAMLIGGACVGAGMAIGGYCPGTSAAALASGRLDGVVFMGGMVIGTGAFAGLFDILKPLYLAAAGPEAQTLPDLFGVSSAAILVAIALVGVAGFYLGSRLEKASGGALSAQMLDDDATRDEGKSPAIGGLNANQGSSV